MSSIAVSEKYIIVSKGLLVECYDHHETNEISISTKSTESDFITNLQISPNGKYLGLITSMSKQLLVYELPSKTLLKSFELPRSASRIRFTPNNENILVADKSGDVLLYDMNNEGSGSKLLGHLSLLLDVLQTSDEKFIITSDRDEKIRVTCYPNTYNIQTYCLGHKEFVNHIELLPHNKSYLISTSGDGHIKCWDYTKGHLCYSIDTYNDINESEIKESFTKSMSDEGIEVNALPIVHLGVSKIDENSSLIVVAIHNYKQLIFYKFSQEASGFNHNLIQKVKFKDFPSSLTCFNYFIYTYTVFNNLLTIYKIRKNGDGYCIDVRKCMHMSNKFADAVMDNKEDCNEAIKILYKRKFDNVQEYQERKRQRLEKSENSV